MKEIFESTINNVDELIMKGYDDPDEYNNKLEILAKTGTEEHVYVFIGPGVSANIFNRLNRKNMELSAENEKLKELKTPTIENFANEEPSSRANILDKAKECVCGQREQDYGTPESNFQLIADLWNGYLGSLNYPQWKQIQAKDVAMMMALMKIARIRNGGGSGDSFVDLAGYAACGGEIYYGERHSDK